MGYEVLGQTNKFIRTRKLQRSLRKDMTIAERKLWSALRLGQMNRHKFRRQHPFENYILDFVCLEEKLVVEVDGSQHFEQINKDEVRTKILEKAGFRVMRFWNNQVMNEFENVKEAIFLAVETHPHPSLPLEGEGIRLIKIVHLNSNSTNSMVVSPTFFSTNLAADSRHSNCPSCIEIRLGSPSLIDCSITPAVCATRTLRPGNDNGPTDSPGGKVNR